MNNPTDTPRTDACPHCGAEELEGGIMKCHSYVKTHANAGFRSMLCYERETAQKLETEVERLKAILSDPGSAYDELYTLRQKYLEEMERANKAEAKLEQLDKLLTDSLGQHAQFVKNAESWIRQAIEIAEEFSLGGVFALEAITASGRWAFEPQNDPRRIIKSANDKFNQLKATLNPQPPTPNS